MKNLIIDIKNWIEGKKFINKCRYLELTYKKRTEKNTKRLLKKQSKKNGKINIAWNGFNLLWK